MDTKKSGIDTVWVVKGNVKVFAVLTSDKVSLDGLTHLERAKEIFLIQGDVLLFTPFFLWQMSKRAVKANHGRV